MGKSTSGGRRLPALAPVRRAAAPVAIQIGPDRYSSTFPLLTVTFHEPGTGVEPRGADIRVFGGEGYIRHSRMTDEGAYQREAPWYPAVAYLADAGQCICDGDCDGVAPRYCAALLADPVYERTLATCGWGEDVLRGARGYWARGHGAALGVMRTAGGRIATWHTEDEDPVFVSDGICSCIATPGGHCLHTALAASLGADRRSIWSELGLRGRVGDMRLTASAPGGYPSVVTATDTFRFKVSLARQSPGGRWSHELALDADLRLRAVTGASVRADMILLTLGEDGVFAPCGTCVDEQVDGECAAAALADGLYVHLLRRPA